jgi:hypothetical protein
MGNKGIVKLYCSSSEDIALLKMEIVDIVSHLVYLHVWTFGQIYERIRLGWQNLGRKFCYTYFDGAT